jgi:hypothetical protein
MGTITYHVAASLDGYIERADGSFDGFEWDDDVVADFTADIERFDTVTMGGSHLRSNHEPQPTPHQSTVEQKTT